MMNPAEFANIAKAERDFWWYRGMREILYRLLDPIARAGRFERVLEAGCGTGYLSKVLAERYGWTIFPMDLGREGLAYARGYGLQRLVQGDIASVPFAAESFDALLSIDVIVYLDRGREQTGLEEFARVLKPGGLLVLRVSALDVLRSRHSEFAQDRQRFTRSRLAEVVSQAGFHVERVTYCNAWLLPVALFKFRVWEPVTRAEPSSGVTPVPAWLGRLLHLPLRAEAAAIGGGWNFPVGQSLVLLARKR